MRLWRTDVEEELGRGAAAVLDRRAPMPTITDVERSAPGYDVELHRELLALGWLELALPRTLAVDAHPALLAAVLAALGRRAVPTPIGALAASIMVLRAAGGTAGDQLCGAIATGATAATCVAPSRGRPVPVHAHPAGDGWRIEGGPLLVEWSNASSVLLVLATLEGPGEGHLLVSVDATAAGVDRRPVGVMDGQRVARISLAGVEVGPDRAMSTVPLARERVDEMLAARDLLRLVDLAGAARAALDLTVEYTSNRRVFGRPIAHFQAVRHRLADLAILLDGADLAIGECVERLAADLPIRDHVAVAVVHAGRSAERTAIDAAQLHGGIGYTTEYPLHHLYRRVKAQRLRLGARHEQVSVAADALAIGRRDPDLHLPVTSFPAVAEATDAPS